MAAPALDDDPQVFTLQDGSGLQIQVCDLGAAWLSCVLPMADGTRRELLLAHPHPRELSWQPGYLGVVVGRYANRIAGARFELDGQAHPLLANEGEHHLHGGPDGFHRRRWQVQAHSGQHLQLSLHSPAGDQGYPGELHTVVDYRLQDGAVTIGFGARTSAPCPVGPTSHAYFNLDGDARSVLGHGLQVAASQWLPVGTGQIPTGTLQPVAGTGFDLQQARRVDGTWDHCLVLDEEAAAGLAPAATLTASDERLSMQLHTNYPALQVYAGRHLEGVTGRQAAPLPAHAGIALEPQFFPDAPNHPVWQQQGCILRPGQTLSRWLRLSFHQRPGRA